MNNSGFDGAGYWDARYRAGGTSGDGSYGDLAHFKAQVVNGIIRQLNARSVIEWGCGDGNQLGLFIAPIYLGVDTSQTAVEHCQAMYAHDATKQFCLPCDYHGETFDLALSLDVVFHLTQHDLYLDYMYNLFNSSKYVLVYSTDTDHQQTGQSPHMQHHCHSALVEQDFHGHELLMTIPNDYPHRSVSDFCLYGPRRAKA